MGRAAGGDAVRVDAVLAADGPGRRDPDRRRRRGARPVRHRRAQDQNSDLVASTRPELKVGLDALHRAKIAMSSSVTVVTDQTGYWGASTRSEIDYALSLGLPVHVCAVDRVTGYADHRSAHGVVGVVAVRPARVLYALLGVVAAAAAVLSFSALRDLALVCGFAPQLAWLLPVVVDAGAAAGSLVWLGGQVAAAGPHVRPRARTDPARAVGRGQRTRPRPGRVRLAPAWWVVVIVSAVAPAVLGAVVHLAVLVGRPEPATRTSRRRRRACPVRADRRGLRGRPARRARPVPAVGRPPRRPGPRTTAPPS